MNLGDQMYNRWANFPRDRLQSMDNVNERKQRGIFWWQPKRRIVARVLDLLQSGSYKI